MIQLLLHVVALTGTVLVLAKLLPGVRINSIRSAVVVALVFGGLNLLVGWLVKALLSAVLLLPAIVTLGLAWLFVPFLANLLLLWITDKILDAFELRDGKTLLIAAGAITVVNWVLHQILG